MSRPFAVRGVVEGFYGRPWSHAARLDVLSFVGERGMNAYMYAPKDDPRHRARWREPYDADQVALFAELARHGERHGVRVGYAIAPGLDIDYGSAADRAALLGKLRPLVDAGIGWLLLALDDIPLQPGLGPRQADLAAWLLEGLHAARSDTDLLLCPTEYVGTRPSSYLSGLTEGLPSDIDVMWTGPTVCSPEIRAGDAAAWAEAVGGHGVVLWDNYPVNDGPMERRLHLGPYRRRDPDLSGLLRGVLCNPMLQSHASLVALATAAEFLSDPDAYDPEAAWARALTDVGGTRAEPLGALARACGDSALSPSHELPAAALVEAIAEEIDTPGWVAPVQFLADDLRLVRGAVEAFPAGGDPLADELAPWAQQARLEAEAGLWALRVLQQVRPAAVLAPDGSGRVAPPRAETLLEYVFMLVLAWSAARSAATKDAFGPRFAVYPAIVQMPDGRPAVDVSLTVTEDANVIDALCRLALDRYEAWRLDPVDTTRAFVDREERPVAPDGTFDARGEVVLVRAGPLSTRIPPWGTLPFREPRLP